MITRTGEIIKQIRIRRGLTQKQLGELCGSSEPAIRNYELGNRNPSRDKLDRIAAALNVTVSELTLPELLSELENYGFEIVMSDDKPIICAKCDHPMLEMLLKEYMESTFSFQT